MKNAPLRLGATTCVLDGYDPTWLNGDTYTSGIFDTAKQALETTEPEQVAAKGKWGFPVITLHEDAMSLLNELFPAKTSLLGKDPLYPVYNAGTLLTTANKEKALKDLQKVTGIDLSKEGMGYALVMLTRTDSNQVHPAIVNGVLSLISAVKPAKELGVSEEFRKEKNNLPHFRDEEDIFNPDLFTVSEVNEYLSFFRKYGTHFISRLVTGDAIFQVFAYDMQRYERVKKAFNTNAGLYKEEGTANFAYYTATTKDGPFGYVAETGNIVAFSKDATLAKSIKAGDWKDETWTKEDSIFSIFNTSTKTNLEWLNKNMNAAVPVRYELSTLAAFAEAQRSEAWRRIFTGALVQKFPNGTRPNLEEYFDADVDSLAGSQGSNAFASVLATPSINVYRSLVGLAELNFIAADTITDLTLATNLLKASDGSQVSISGKSITLAAQTILAESQDKVATIHVTEEDADDPMQLFCRRCYGVLRIHYAKDNTGYTILDGIKLVSEGKEVKADVKLCGKEDSKNKFAPLPAAVLGKLKSSLQYSYTFLQSSYGSELLEQTPSLRGFLREGLEWIARLIPGDNKDADLQAIRMMSLEAVRSNNVRRTRVPLLKSGEYDNYVGSILAMLNNVYTDRMFTNAEIEQRRTQEMLIDVAKTLNENIYRSGKALVSFIEKSADYQKTMGNYYGEIADKEELGYKKQLEYVNNLQTGVDRQQEEVNRAVKKYQEKVKEWAKYEGFKVAFHIISDIFSAAAGDASKATGALAELMKIIDKIKKIAKVLAALYSAYGDAKKSVAEMRDASHAMEEIEGAEAMMMTKEDWDEMRIHFDTVLRGGPDDEAANEAKDELVAAYNILVIRGKALLEARSAASRSGKEVFNARRLREIAAAQADSLKEIKAEFKDMDPAKFNTKKTDLIGLTGRLDLIQNQMLTMLSKAFIARDNALQYEFMQPGTAVNDFSLAGFNGAIVRQEHNKTIAKEALAAKPSTNTGVIDYVIKSVPVEDITNGRSLRVNIGLDSKEFTEYVRVRVTSVVASCDTKVTAQNDKFNLTLRYLADPFMDRDLDRQPREYVSQPRERVYQYHSETMKPAFDDGGKTWSEDGMEITPFSTWELAFEKTELNKDLKFASRVVDLRISFKLNTRVKDKPVLKKAMLKAGDPRPSKEDLLKKMALQGAVTNKWDVVYNMSLSKINSTLAAQYKEMQKKPSYSNTIKGEIVTEGVTVDIVKKFEFDYAYPELKFLENNPKRLSLVCTIKGKIQLCERKEDGTETCKKPKEFKDEKLTALVSLETVTGLVQPQQTGSKVYSVVLDMAKGSFDAANMDLSDDQMADFNKLVKDHFTTHKVQYIISSLDLSKISTLDDLRPNEFLFKTLITAGGSQILQMFIQTNNRKAFNESLAGLNNIPEPIPAGYTASLMISSNLFFGSIMPASISNGWQLTGRAPKTDEGPQNWNADFTNGTLHGVVDTSKLDKDYSSSSGGMYGGGGTTYTKLRYYMNDDGSKTVNWAVTGMKIAPMQNGTLRLSFKETRTIPIIEKADYTYQMGFSRWSDPTKITRYTSNVGVDINANIPVDVVAGSNLKEQSLSINLKDQSVDITGHMEGGGFCGCDDLQAIVNRAIREQIPQQITKMLNVSFAPVSVFALKNLLFPGDNVITLKSAYTPGDMVIFGDFVD